MATAPTLLYYATLGLVGLASFWDAPLRLIRARGQGELATSRRYHVVNLGSVLLLGGWLVLVGLGLDVGLPGIDGAWRWVGLVVAGLGASVSLAARLALGGAFAPTAVVYHDQGVVEAGPFALVRHPFYLGGVLMVAGGVLALSSLVTLVVLAALVPIVRELAMLEEEHLTSQLGGAYRTYARDRPRFVPGLRAPGVGRPR